MADFELTDMQGTNVILDSISDGVFTVDLNWKVTSFNRAAEEITGIPRDEAIGEYCYAVFRSSMCETNCALKKTISTGKPLINKNCYIINANGEKIPISISTAVIKDGRGKIIGGAETFRDLRELTALRQEIDKKYRIGDMVTRSSSMKEIFEMIPIVAESNSTVLIEGETGTGKELLARAIHSEGSRNIKPFIAVNCAALPDTLLESELFGYKKGAFTGADRDKKGRFALAEDGTLFLDEIGEISTTIQVKLLRVLQEHEYEPLGAEKTEKSNVRIIAATNKDLNELVQKGEFRQDLYYRINVIKFQLPSLKRRTEDIPLLIDHFIMKYNRLQKKNIKKISSNAEALLISYEWKGNIRELENVIERAFVLCNGSIIEVKHLPSEIKGEYNSEILSYEEAMQKLERDFLIKALERNGNDRRKTALELGIHLATLYRKLKKSGLT